MLISVRIFDRLASKRSRDQRLWAVAFKILAVPVVAIAIGSAGMLLLTPTLATICGTAFVAGLVIGGGVAWATTRDPQSGL